MLTAKNSLGKTVYIDEVDKSQPCFCKLCNQPLVQRRGVERSAHFAHYPSTGKKGSYTQCVDSWSHDTSEWHISWQKKYDPENMEYVMEGETGKHIADVFIGEIVIEFQHSPISYKEFCARNNFYHKKGYKVVWVFDLIEEYEEESLRHEYGKNDGYIWSSPRRPFKDVVEFESQDLAIYLQFADESNDGGRLERVIKGYRGFTSFYTDEKHALSVEEFLKFSKESSNNLFKKHIDEKPLLEVSGGKTIYDIWEPDSHFIIVQNLSDPNVVMRIDTYDENIHEDKYGNIKGKYAKKDWRGLYCGKGDYYRVKNADKPIWKLIFKSVDTDYKKRKEARRAEFQEREKKLEEERRIQEQKKQEEHRKRLEILKKIEEQRLFEKEQEERNKELRNMPVRIQGCFSLNELLYKSQKSQLMLKNEYTKRSYLFKIKPNPYGFCYGYKAYELDPISGDIDEIETDISATPSYYGLWSIISDKQ